MSKQLKGYWGGVQERMKQKLDKHHHLDALVVRHAGYNRNVRGLSFRAKDGHLVHHRYRDERQRNE
ncbi:hypothetical protein NMS23_003556 [Vibrio parahaemolyticus]|nr:hypothetical protein [Vibrio parahaemolyticus]